MPSETENADARRRICKVTLDERTVGDFVPSLFGELSPCHGLQLLTGLDLALGDRPVADVLPGPERSALMCEEHLQAALPVSPEQDASTRASRLADCHSCLPRVD